MRTRERRGSRRRRRRFARRAAEGGSRGRKRRQAKTRDATARIASRRRRPRSLRARGIRPGPSNTRNDGMIHLHTTLVSFDPFERPFEQPRVPLSPSPRRSVYAWTFARTRSTVSIAASLASPPPLARNACQNLRRVPRDRRARLPRPEPGRPVPRGDRAVPPPPRAAGGRVHRPRAPRRARRRADGSPLPGRPRPRRPASRFSETSERAVRGEATRRARRRLVGDGASPQVRAELGAKHRLDGGRERVVERRQHRRSLRFEIQIHARKRRVARLVRPLVARRGGTMPSSRGRCVPMHPRGRCVVPRDRAIGRRGGVDARPSRRRVDFADVAPTPNSGLGSGAHLPPLHLGVRARDALVERRRSLPRPPPPPPVGVARESVRVERRHGDVVRGRVRGGGDGGVDVHREQAHELAPAAAAPWRSTQSPRPRRIRRGSTRSECSQRSEGEIVRFPRRGVRRAS